MAVNVNADDDDAAETAAVQVADADLLQALRQREEPQPGEYPLEISGVDFYGADLQGVNLAAMAAMCDACPCDIVASGGVTNADDIRNLVALKRPNLAGVIIGKALYEGRVNLPQLLKETSA